MAENYQLSYTAEEIDRKLGQIDDKLNSSELNSAIDTALAEAKASGDFNGQDGISVTHSWNGTTLTITSASGTSSSDLKGEKGDTYTLTEADKAEIAKLSNTVEIPDYWQEHINQKISEINALQSVGGKDCFSFVVIADMHYPANLGKISPLLAKEIIEKCDIKYVMCLGDVQNRGCYTTKEDILDENINIEVMLSPIRDRLLQTEGNHDGAYGLLDRDGDGTISNEYSDGTTKPPAERESYVYNLTPAELHSTIYRKVGMVGDVYFDECGSGYYIDDTANKVRYIVLNTQNNKYELQADETVKYPKMWLFRFGQSQFDFLVEALNNIPSDSWNVVVAGHCPITQEIGDREVMQGVLNAYKNKTTYSGSYAGTAEGENYTNQIPISTDIDGNIYNSKGYKDGYRLNSSYQEVALEDSFITGFIPIKAGDTIHLNGNYIDADSENAGSLRNIFYKSDKTTPLATTDMSKAESTGYGYSSFETNSDGYVTSFTIRETWEYVGDAWKDLAYVRLNLLGSGEGCIVTVNEEIVESEHGYDYVNVEADFTTSKGKLTGYFHGHNHQDSVQSNYGFNIIGTRCDGAEENTETLKNERIVGTTTEQSFDVFTVNKAEGKIYATKIGAGDNREIPY